MHESIEGLLKSLSENGISSNTIKAYRADLKGFAEWAGPHQNRPTEKLAQNYLNYLRAEKGFAPPVSPRTILRKASALRALGRYMGEPAFLAGYRCPQPPRAMPHPLPEGINGVLELLTAAPTNRHRALIALCGLCGLRVTEARLVAPAHVNPDEMTITVFGKGDKWRTIPMGTTAWHFIKSAYAESLTRDQSGGGSLVMMSDRGARKFLTQAGVKLGLGRSIASHDLRATFATAAYAKTKDLRAVQELLGHASSQTTESYTGISMSAMRKAAEVV